MRGKQHFQKAKELEESIEREMLEAFKLCAAEKVPIEVNRRWMEQQGVQDIEKWIGLYAEILKESNE